MQCSLLDSSLVGVGREREEEQSPTILSEATPPCPNDLQLGFA
jgi:hypothetical protein